MQVLRARTGRRASCRPAHIQGPARANIRVHIRVHIRVIGFGGVGGGVGHALVTGRGPGRDPPTVRGRVKGVMVTRGRGPRSGIQTLQAVCRIGRGGSRPWLRGPHVSRARSGVLHESLRRSLSAAPCAACGGLFHVRVCSLWGIIPCVDAAVDAPCVWMQHVRVGDYSTCSQGDQARWSCRLDRTRAQLGPARWWVTTAAAYTTQPSRHRRRPPPPSAADPPSAKSPRAFIVNESVNRRPPIPCHVTLLE